jgi:hypothetical protein
MAWLGMSKTIARVRTRARQRAPPPPLEKARASVEVGACPGFFDKRRRPGGGAPLHGSPRPRPLAAAQPANAHFGLKPHACSHCEATFTAASSLKQRLSAMHLGLKPYACSHCEATFTEVSSLKAHLSSVQPRAQAARVTATSAWRRTRRRRISMATAHPEVALGELSA